MLQDNESIPTVEPLCSISLDVMGKFSFDTTVELKTVRVSMLFLPKEIRWLFFKQKNASIIDAGVLDTHIGLFSGGQLTTFKNFARLNLKLGYAYTIKSIVEWLELVLGPTEQLYEAMDLLPPPNFNRVKQLDPDLARCLELLAFWQQDNITQTHAELNAAASENQD